MANLDGRRVIDQDQSLVIYPEDSILIDSVTNGTRQITYEALCAAVARTLRIDAIASAASAAMQRTVYDRNGDGIVDNSAALEGHAASYFATADALGAVIETANSAMQKSVYDTNNSGVVDNAEKVNTHTVDKDVPSDAKFTDTIYDDSEVREAIRQNTEDIQGLQDGIIGLSVVDGKVQQTIQIP